jgi:hypothetical protein
MPKTGVHNKSELYLIYVGKLSKEQPSQLSNDLKKRNIERKIEKLRTLFVIVSFHESRSALQQRDCLTQSEANTQTYTDSQIIIKPDRRVRGDISHGTTITNLSITVTPTTKATH